MKRSITVLLFGILFGVAGASSAAAQCIPSNNFCLTGVGNGASLDGIYVSPYTATVNGVVGTNVICDDFYDDVNINESWSVSSPETVSTAATSGLFATSTVINPLLGYEEVAYLSQQLMQLAQNPSGLIPSAQLAQQDLLSYSIWAVFDPGTAVTGVQGWLNANPSGGLTWTTVQGELASITPALLAADNFSNVAIYTPTGGETCCGPAQEFVVVSTPEAPVLANLTVDFLGLGVLLFVFRRYRFATR